MLLKYMPHERTDLSCFPLAASPSNLAKSSGCSLSFSAAASVPLKLAAMRAGVTDLGSATMSLATINERARDVELMRYESEMMSYQGSPKEHPTLADRTSLLGW